MDPIDLINRIEEYFSHKEDRREIIETYPEDPDELEMYLINRNISFRESFRKKPRVEEYKPDSSFYFQVIFAFIISFIAILIICWPSSHIPKVFIVEQKTMEEYDLIVPTGPDPDKIPLFDFLGITGRFYQSWLIDKPVLIDRLKREHEYIIIGIDKDNFYPIKGLFYKKHNLPGNNITLRLFRELLDEMINRPW